MICVDTVSAADMVPGGNAAASDCNLAETWQCYDGASGLGRDEWGEELRYAVRTTPVCCGSRECRYTGSVEGATGERARRHAALATIGRAAPKLMLVSATQRIREFRSDIQPLR
jgi:hypothetical protein